MAIFSRKQNTETKKDATAASVAPRAQDLSWVLIKPRITERATDLHAVHAYVFVVDPRANKRNIKDAVTQIYKVRPVRVCVTRIPQKTIRNSRTGKMGMKRGGKKAYVYLKEGDTINIV